MTDLVDVDYLVIGAGAMGMAFTDALVDHSSARVAVVDRREAPGGHWLAAYPFVQLHQASQFYGVASTVFGGAVQTEGPEAGLNERATRDEVCAYYAQVLARLEATGRVQFFGGAEYAEDRTFRSADGTVHGVPAHCRVVDGRLMSPLIPSEVPAPFAVDDDARLAGAHEVPETDADRFVVVGSGKTATDTIVWLLRHRGLDPASITWVRPRDPWMLDRARIQPQPETYLGMVADLVRDAAAARSLPELFLALEESGTMLRIDRSVEPTMAKSPTLGRWELDLLRSVTDVVRLGHVRRARRGRLELEHGSVDIPSEAVVVHCAADGLRNPPLVPIWREDAIMLQPVRAGFPCFGAAITGYVEATRATDGEKNDLCRPSRFGNSREDWARMNVQGFANTAAYRAAPDVAAWANGVAINASRVPPGHSSAELDDILARIARDTPAAAERLRELAG